MIQPLNSGIRSETGKRQESSGTPKFLQKSTATLAQSNQKGAVISNSQTSDLICFNTNSFISADSDDGGDWGRETSHQSIQNMRN